MRYHDREPAPTLPRKAEVINVLVHLLSHRSVTHSHVVGANRLQTCTFRLQFSTKFGAVSFKRYDQKYVSYIITC